MRTEHIFSLLVFGETFPNPTDVNEEKVKYSAVTYLKIILSHNLWVIHVELDFWYYSLCDKIHVMSVFTYQLRVVLPLNLQSDHLHQLHHWMVAMLYLQVDQANQSDCAIQDAQHLQLHTRCKPTNVLLMQIQPSTEIIPRQKVWKLYMAP